MKAFLEDKDEAFAEAHQRALEWTDDFAIYAEKKCVETLQRVQREAQAHYDKQLLRQSLRLIRLPWAEKRAISLMNRQKMRNLLRLCAGWRKVDRSMPKYWRLRTKYHCFLDWMRLVSNHKLYRTSSVKKMLLKRKHRAFASAPVHKSRFHGVFVLNRCDLHAIDATPHPTHWLIYAQVDALVEGTRCAPVPLNPPGQVGRCKGGVLSLGDVRLRPDSMEVHDRAWYEARAAEIAPKNV